MLNLFKIIIFLQLIFWPEMKADDTNNTEIVQGYETKCVLPSPVDNGKYSIISLTTGDFIEPTPGDLVENGSNIIHECNHGYYVNSTPIDICHDGKWEERFHGCIKNNNCDLPEFPLNGSYEATGYSMRTVIPGQQVAEYTILTFYCAPLYVLVDAKNVVCIAGVWTSDPPTCKRNNNCDLPEFPQNGSYEATGYSTTTVTSGQQVAEFTILTFSCAPLYDLVDAKKLVCIAGAWNSDPPTCKQMKADDTNNTEIVRRYDTKCVLPSPVDNGKYSIISLITGDFMEPTPGDLVENGTNIIHECNHGYYVNSIPIDICHDGKWEERFHGCIRYNNCDLPEFPLNGNYKVSGYSNTTVTPGQQVAEYTILTFSCAPLYVLVDAIKVVCIEGAWSSDPPTCKQNNNCDLPEFPQNGNYEASGYSNTTVTPGQQVAEYTILTFSCAPLYDLVDAKIVVCIAGAWNSDPPTCKPTPAAPPASPPIADKPANNGIKNDSTSELTLFKDCSDVSGISGVYNIKPNEQTGTIAVYCELNLDGKKWTVIQQRFDGSVDFYKDYESYKHFFGDAQGNYWIGLENMYQITKNDDHELYVELETHDGHKASARYKTFSVGPAGWGYKLKVKQFDDGSGANDALFSNNGLKFSTFDNDHDVLSAVNCAERFHGGWWYGWCGVSNLNGRYFDTGVNLEESMHWFPWYKKYEALKSTRMLVRKN